MTGVQTCALPICFPVTIQSEEVLPEAELKVLSVLIKYSNGGCIGLGLEVVKEYRKEAGVGGVGAGKGDGDLACAD